MMIRFCEITLNVLLNLLIFLNKKKKINKEVEADSISLGSILKIIEDLKTIELERNKMDKKHRIKAVCINNNIEQLNDRLKNIEELLSDKRADLLKNKILSGEYKEKEDED